MKTSFLRIATLCAAAALTILSAQANEVWPDNYEKALAQAKTEKKLLLAYFTGSDWCPPCKILAEDVFGKQEFKDYAAKNLVLVELDFPFDKTLPEKVKTQNEALHEKFAVEAFPTTIMLDSDGKELARWLGLIEGGPSGLIAKIDALKK